MSYNFCISLHHTLFFIPISHNNTTALTVHQHASPFNISHSRVQHLHSTSSHTLLCHATHHSIVPNIHRSHTSSQLFTVGSEKLHHTALHNTRNIHLGPHSCRQRHSLHMHDSTSLCLYADTHSLKNTKIPQNK